MKWLKKRKKSMDWNGNWCMRLHKSKNKRVWWKKWRRNWLKKLGMKVNAFLFSTHHFSSYALQLDALWNIIFSFCVVQPSRKAADEHTIRTLRESGEEISKRITKQQHKIQELLNNVNELTGQLAQEKDKQDNLEQELQCENSVFSRQSSYQSSYIKIQYFFLPITLS